MEERVVCLVVASFVADFAGRWTRLGAAEFSAGLGTAGLTNSGKRGLLSTRVIEYRLPILGKWLS